MENTIIETFDQNQNFNQENNETTPKNAKNRIRLNHLTEKQKQTLLTGGTAFAGLLVGAGAFSLMGFATKSGDSVEAMKPVTNEDATACVDVYSDAPVSMGVSNDMSFAEAFETARSEVGAGGFFAYKGELYNTYTKEEWEEMSETDHTDYANSIADKFHHIAESSYTPSQSKEISDDLHTESVAHIADEPQSDEFEAPELVKEADVIHRVDVGSDYTIDMYEVDFDKDEHRDFVVDADGDGKFDELVIDLDKHEELSEDDYIDIAALDTSKLTDVGLVDGDGNVLEIHDEPAIDKQTDVANKELDLNQDDLKEGLDLDQDGYNETFVTNSNNNYVEDVAIDVDQSGTVDMIVLDVEDIETDERIHDAISNIEVSAEDVEEIEEETGVEILEEQVDFDSLEEDSIASNDYTENLNDMDDLGENLDDLMY